MKLLWIFLAVLPVQFAWASADEATVAHFKLMAGAIDTSVIDAMPVQNHGRIKPFHTFARETMLYLTGKYGLMGLNASQLFLGLITSDAAPELEVINVRDPALRPALDLPAGRKLFSLKEIESSRLASLAGPAFEKQKANEKSLSQSEKNILEVAEQQWVLRALIQGDLLFSALDLNATKGNTPHNGSPELAQAGAAYLRALVTGNSSEARATAEELVRKVRSQPVPELFRRYLDKLDAEVLFNKLQLFFYAGLLYFLLGLVLAFGLFRERLTPGIVLASVALPFLLHAAGFAFRVYISGFAPVTNMYGTMIWMALGVVLFGGLLFYWYRNAFVYGILLTGAAITLLIAESIPLVLSPDLDPVVAVLRSNFWLTIHVLTVSISYAAFTISMLIGNMALVMTILRGGAPEKSKLEEFAKICYRIIQIGVLLLTTGIILGGWWADYSWGRFWGWDPKETWSLIADLGYLSLLHARFAGWVNSYLLLALSPLAYLLVLMAWYGVNFILAAGLHSYGFSSGGTVAVVTFVGVQLILFALAAFTLRAKANANAKA
jgi:ABC-type transport system involved in cytochrome c biogenesis permease subunit